jgi:DNA modification methylase
MLTLLQGDALEKLQSLESKSVQCCVTSPPYWGLRDYGTAAWEGGEVECEHKRFNAYPTGLVGTDQAQQNSKFFKDACPKCGARRIDSQLGLEPTPEVYIENMVAVFRQVGRVLRDDGTLWLNMGDSYAAQGGSKEAGLYQDKRNVLATWQQARKPACGLKPKDLCGIPWLLAFALQADGWYLRSDIIWHKPNPMPESVTDRPTKAHEYIFLLTKSERYFYDAEAIREPSDLSVSIEEYERIKANGTWPSGGITRYAGSLKDAPSIAHPLGRNKRSVWTIPTQPYADAHFATFPEELPKLCILAGSKPSDIVLDPFAGSGTTGQVAIELGRKVILIELNPDYCEMIQVRCTTTIGIPFTQSTPLTDAESPAQLIQMLLRF